MEMEAKPRQLTLVVTGADVYQASCPELRLAYYSEDINVARNGLYRALNRKATSIVKSNGHFPIADLVPYAELFVNNRNRVKESLLKGREILITDTEK
jgi:hypothetical protein